MRTLTIVLAAILLAGSGRAQPAPPGDVGAASSRVADIQSRSTQQEPAFESGPLMMEAVTKVLATGLKAGRMFDNALAWYENVSVIGGLVTPGRSASFTFPLDRGSWYAFIGAGDDDAQDVDISIADSRGHVVATDTDRGASPLVMYRVPQQGNYTVTVRLAEAPVRCFVALAVLTDGPRRFEIPLSSIRDALQTSLIEAEMFADEAGEARYHEQTGQWAMFRQVVQPGSSMRIANITLKNEVHAIFGAGDAAAQDLDLFIKRDGKLLISDERSGKLPLAVLRTPAGSGYEIELRNVKSTGPSLVVAIIIE